MGQCISFRFQPTFTVPSWFLGTGSVARGSDAARHLRVRHPRRAWQHRAAPCCLPEPRDYRGNAAGARGGAALGGERRRQAGAGGRPTIYSLLESHHGYNHK